MPQDAEIVSLEAHRPVPLKPTPKRAKRRFIAPLLLTLIVIGIGLIVWRGVEANRAARVAIEELTALSNNPELIDSVISQNTATQALTPAEVAALDTQYRSDAKTGGGMVAALITRPQSLFLKQYVDGANARIVLIMVMDAKGLNVADSRPTHDYYQGDEAKWQKTFQAGAGAVHWGDLERDDVTNRLMHVVSRTMIDPKTGEPIGAVAIGFDDAALKR